MRKTKVKVIEHRGITLMSLVITVIVLLILAGISVGMISGDNGILRKAINTKQNANEASIVEDIKKSIVKLKMEGKTISKEVLEKELGKSFDKLEVITNGKDKYIVEINGKIYNIENDSDVSSGYKKEITESGVISGAIDESYLRCRIYGNTVHDDGTPSPDNPIESKSCGDRTKNILDLSATNFGEFDKNGDYVCPAHVGVYKLSNIKENTQYTLSATIKNTGTENSYPRIYFLYSDGTTSSNSNRELKNYTSEYAYKTAISEPNKTVTGIEISYANSGGYYNIKEGKIQLEEGTEATEYEPYGYKIPVRICGNNLFNINSAIISGGTEEDGKIISTGSCNIDIYLKAGTYSIKLEKDFDSSIYFRKGQVSSGYFSEYKVSGNVKKIVLDTDGYLRMSHFKKDGIIQNIIIQDGEYSDLEYEPYHSNTTNIYLNEPLRKVGDYTDYIDLLNGKIVRQVEKKRLEGPVALYSTYDDYQGFYKNVFYDNWVSMSANFYCNRLSRTSSVIYLKNQASFSHGDKSGRVYFSLPKTIAASTDEAKTWLEYNETYFIYPKETKEENDVDIQKMLINKGTNILNIDTETKPSKTEVTYYKSNK